MRAPHFLKPEFNRQERGIHSTMLPELMLIQIAGRADTAPRLYDI